MLLSQVHYFVALARARHFGRAAAESFVSQSTLSEAISKLELELGVPLVRRGRAFEGLTPEGERLLVWARRLVADERALREAAAPTALAGTVRLGVIPTGLRDAARLVRRLGAAHPLLEVQLLTGLSSEQIGQRIERFELDAGVLYPVRASGGQLRVTQLGRTRQWVVAAPGALADRPTIAARDLAELPLALLDRSMRGRQVLDDALAGHGIELRPSIEADSAEALVELAATGGWYAVLPRSGAAEPGASAVDWSELVEPRVVSPLLLAVHAEEPLAPVSGAVLLAALQDRP